MFKATIESKSHEGGLLASFTGSSPALGSIIVRVDDGSYIGKIDAVLGNTDAPIAHIAHLDRKINPTTFLGCEAQIRPKASNQYDDRKPRNDQYSNRERRENRRNNNMHNHRDPGRGNFRDRDSNRRDSGRGNFSDNNSRYRSGGRDSGRGNFRHNNSKNRPGGREKKIFADNDWTCTKCNNSNFSFRKECNRCGEPKSGNSERGNNKSRRDKPARNDRRSRNDSEPRKFRKARGKSPNHAHNRGPKPLDARSRRRNRDD